MKIQKFIFILISILSITACTSPKVSQQSNDKLYKKDNNELGVKYAVFHINDSVSQLFYEINNETIIYKKSDTSNLFFCNLKVDLNISSEDNIDKRIAAETFVINDKQTVVTQKIITGNYFFKLKSGSNYYLEINVFDIHKKTKYNSNVYINKLDKDSRQNFLTVNLNNQAILQSYFKANDAITITSLQNKEKLFQVDYFKPNFRLALPPFSTEQMQRFTYKPDSIFSVYVRDDKAELKLPSKGFFHLKTNAETKDGVTFYVYESVYPKIKNAEQMILSTRYIMAKKEFDNCLNADDKKAAIDKFWLDLGGSNERAKELIKKYYGRVQEANKLFTSYQEGWKTDRGMMYIVFGAPNTVTKRKNGEIWTYGEIGNMNSLQYSFIKIINPFTDNDFSLERNENFKAPWYQAVDMWRQGRVYLDN